jgi:hypothetical protein
MRSPTPNLSTEAGEPQERFATLARHWLKDVYSFSPKGHYNYACLLARQHPPLEPTDPTPAPPDVAAAVRHLRLASAAVELRAFMAKDPWLSQLRETQEYRRAFLDAKRTDLLTLDPYAKHADALRKAGLGSADQLARTSEWRLGTYLKIDTLEAHRLVRLAELAKLVDGDLNPFQVEITDALLSQGIDCPATLTDKLGTTSARVLAKKLLENIHDRCKDEPHFKDVTQWLASRRR